MHRAVNFLRREFPMRSSQQFRNFSCAVALCTIAFFGGCGRKTSGLQSQSGENAFASGDEKLAELPLSEQIEQKLDPLTKHDVDLYLRVMRAAAERVKHLTPADQAALD